MASRPRQLPIARAAAGAALVVWLLNSASRPPVAPATVPVEPSDFAAVPDVWVSDVRHDASGPLGAGKRMPPKPFDGQRKPPCAEAQVPLKGGCWYQVLPAPGSTRPGVACAPEMYEADGKCYLPVLRAERPPTSIRE